MQRTAATTTTFFFLISARAYRNDGAAITAELNGIGLRDQYAVSQSTDRPTDDQLTTKALGARSRRRTPGQ